MAVIPCVSNPFSDVRLANTVFSPVPVVLLLILCDGDVSAKALVTRSSDSLLSKKLNMSKTRGLREMTFINTGSPLVTFTCGRSKISPTAFGANMNTRPAGTA